MAKDLQLFNKLSKKEQVREIKKFIKTFPKSQQAKLTKELLG